MAKLDKRKLELMLPQDELGDFLRRLAEGLDTGVFVIADTSMVLDGFNSLRVSVEPKNDACRVKLRIKHPNSRLEYAGGVFHDTGTAGSEAEAPPKAEPVKAKASSGRPDYDDLKERMDVDFKAIRSSLEQGALPDPALAARFVADSGLMTTYEGKGDEFYAEYDQAVARFVEAMEDGGLQEVGAAVDVLRALKKRCHDIYK